MISLFFLAVACAPVDESLEEAKPDYYPTDYFPEPEKPTQAEPVEIELPKKEKLNNVSSSLDCSKGNQKISYAVDNNPQTSDAEGNPIVCQLYQDNKLAFYANWDKGFCDKKLEEIRVKRILEGWSCQK